MKKGLSLVELIAVIVIMGIIISVGGIAVSKIIDDSRKQTAIQASNDIYDAGFNYSQMNHIESGTFTIGDLSEFLEGPTMNKNTNIVFEFENNSLIIKDNNDINNIIKIDDYYLVYTGGTFEAYSTLESAKAH